MPSHRKLLLGALAGLLLAAGVPPGIAGAGGNHEPELVGRAVLPVGTEAPGPPAGAALPAGPTNGFTFPREHQPVQGFSAVIDGREPGEYLAMPDNGFGAKANSKDFNIRAYFIRPDFKTARRGTGAVAVGDYIEFRDPGDVIGFDIVNDTTTDRVLTGGDIDPESLQRAHNGDYWVGDEFGPWILHFDPTGVLLDPPFSVTGVNSPNNPLTGPVTHPNSRGFEAMAMTPDGKRLHAVLEGPTIADAGTARRHVVEFDMDAKAFTGRSWEYRTESPAYLVADADALDENRMVVIERDGGLGVNALFRKVFVVDRRAVGADGFLVKREVVNLAELADPDLVSLPALHAGDVGLGNPFRVTCESVEAVHVLDGTLLLVGCDNNFPNKGRNPGLADDNEFIVVSVPGLRSTASVGGGNASCVAGFTAGIAPGDRGEVIRFGAHELHPFGARIVSQQATRPRDECIVFDV